ncbi:MAG: dTDP-4-dehydrorhamnose 3,5-epimerase [Parcubacteria group bacterium Gr01-1014_56]|nr:MAG: dTDP-4-dehydrorhamnose 3,5-epimerase [Parcubacteria group bacterium Gr01-1014_56]
MSSFTKTALAFPGVLLITPVLREDARGNSLTIYNEEEFTELGITTRFVQDYASFSKKGVVRGLHYQRPPHAQDKLIRPATGKVLDIVAVYDQTSPDFSKYISVELDAKKGEMLFVPGTYAHGFCVLNDEGALVEYKLSDGYHPELAGGARWNDPLFAITWPMSDPIVSAQDAAWPLLTKD